MRDIVVIYHKGCPDGIAGAWVADTILGDTADYVPGVHQMEPSEELAGKTIYFIDFAYPPEVMQQLAEKNEQLIVLDHHQTTEPSMTYAAKGSVLDNAHSGSVIAWHYFHPDRAVPRILQYIEDVDLWKFSLPHVREVAAYLEAEELSFPALTDLAERLEDDNAFSFIVEEGRVTLDYKNALIRRIAKKASHVLFEGYRVLAVNSPVLDSEIGHALYTEVPPLSITWYERSRGIKVSLRSDGSVDVSKLAAKYGGGGHAASAAFKLPLSSSLPWEYLETL